jgi:hypothetical protein
MQAQRSGERFALPRSLSPRWLREEIPNISARNGLMFVLQTEFRLYLVSTGRVHE